LPDPQLPLSDRAVNSIRVRLGIAQSKDGPRPKNCRTLRELEVSPPKGAVYRFTQTMWMTTYNGSANTSNPVSFNPANGRTLTVQLDGLRLRLIPKPGNSSFTLCE